MSIKKYRIYFETKVLLMFSVLFKVIKSTVFLMTEEYKKDGIWGKKASLLFANVINSCLTFHLLT